MRHIILLDDDMDEYNLLSMAFKEMDMEVQILKSHRCYRSLPVIIYSTADNEKEIYESLALGATLYLQKSTSFEAMKNNLRLIMSLDLNSASGWTTKKRIIVN